MPHTLTLTDRDGDYLTLHEVEWADTPRMLVVGCHQEGLAGKGKDYCGVMLDRGNVHALYTALGNYLAEHPAPGAQTADGMFAAMHAKEAARRHDADLQRMILDDLGVPARVFTGGPEPTPSAAVKAEEDRWINARRAAFTDKVINPLMSKMMEGEPAILPKTEWQTLPELISAGVFNGGPPRVVDTGLLRPFVDSPGPPLSAPGVKFIIPDDPPADDVRPDAVVGE